jgi:prephenate dehydrogenase
MTLGEPPVPARAVVVGLGLIGGSVGLALRGQGWHVTGRDLDPAREARALELGVLDAVGDDAEADVTFVATPVRAVVDEVTAALAKGPGLVTDVGSVKASIVEAVDTGDPGSAGRFVGGHPMAGSEQDGVDGARADLFQGATWVLTPSSHTDATAYARLQQVVGSLGADVVALPPERHDGLVAVVSHVPHLTAATLMRLAAGQSDQHHALLRLAAGGFRDMTRIAAGSPDIWPDICGENRQAIAAVLDELVAALQDMRRVVLERDRAGLLRVLEDARAARANLPSRFATPDDLREVRVPVPDRPGVLAQVTTAATEIGVNILDLEIAHSPEGHDRGVLILLVESGAVDPLRVRLADLGYSAVVSPVDGLQS